MAGQAKRRRTTATTDRSAAPPKPTRRRFKGKLQGMSQMPMDVVYEIFGYLQPADLLNLARTSKQLRSQLMSRRSKSVWKQCRANVPGLPYCPPDLDEPEYAELAFGKSCYDCGRNHVNNIVIWLGRTRLCSKCFKQQYSDTHDLTHEYMLHLIPGVRKDGSWYINNEVYYYWMMEVSTMDDATLAAWITEKEEQRGFIIEHANACDAWQMSILESLFEERLTEVEARVRKLDRGGELTRLRVHPDTGDALPDPTDHLDIQKLCLKKLGPKAWETIDSIIKEEIFARFSLRYEIECQKALEYIFTVRNNIVMALPQSEAYIPLADLILSPGYGQIFSTYVSESMKSAQDARVLDITPAKFREYHANWVKRNTRLLVEKARHAFAHSIKHPRSDPTEAIDLDDHQQCLDFVTRATVFFRCADCSDDLRYPSVLAHHCAFDFRPGDVDHENLLVKTVLNCLDSLTWDRRRIIQFRDHTFMAATAFVEFCGMNPKATKLSEMDTFVVECLLCRRGPEPDRTLMLGSTALYHCLDRKLDGYFPRHHQRFQDRYKAPDFSPEEFAHAFRRRSSVDVAAFKARLEQHKQKLLPADNLNPDDYVAEQWRVCCTQCPLVGSSSKMDAHKKEEHPDVASEDCLKICRGDFQSEFVPEKVICR